MPGVEPLSLSLSFSLHLSLSLSRLRIISDKDEKQWTNHRPRYCSPRVRPTCPSSTTPLSPFQLSGFGREIHGAYCHRPGPPKPEHVRDIGGFERRSSTYGESRKERARRTRCQRGGGGEKKGGAGE
ncbi:hypothetical protein CKAH01_06734 [Colletotrichum kahawae]|uniref:Uncharacterized protein n=1 Tax=Colletotrichum kahawae TaxID=34407 RepID=A0AAD9Y8V8_COLKA|nr:hypothetical protein CKAH01_06734 [Colletotrichum kahawae]